MRSVLAKNESTAYAMSSCFHNLVDLACHIGGVWSRRLMQHRQPADSIIESLIAHVLEDFDDAVLTCASSQLCCGIQGLP